jgi:hypothetical protein
MVSIKLLPNGRASRRRRRRRRRIFLCIFNERQDMEDERQKT